jgi:hypothetical protein
VTFSDPEQDRVYVICQQVDAKFDIQLKSSASFPLSLLADCNDLK